MGNSINNYVEPDTLAAVLSDRFDVDKDAAHTVFTCSSFSNMLFADSPFFRYALNHNENVLEFGYDHDSDFVYIFTAAVDFKMSISLFTSLLDCVDEFLSFNPVFVIYYEHISDELLAIKRKLSGYSRLFLFDESVYSNCRMDVCIIYNEGLMKGKKFTDITSMLKVQALFNEYVHLMNCLSHQLTNSKLAFLNFFEYERLFCKTRTGGLSSIAQQTLDFFFESQIFCVVCGEYIVNAYAYNTNDFRLYKLNKLQRKAVNYAELEKLDYSSLVRNFAKWQLLRSNELSKAMLWKFPQSDAWSDVVEEFRMKFFTYTVKVFNAEELVCEIFVDRSVVTFKNYSTNVMFLPFGKLEEAGYSDLKEYYKSRCFPEDRANCMELLKRFSLSHYDPELICRKTHGQQFDDFIWLQFSDEEQVSYQDIKLRD